MNAQLGGVNGLLLLLPDGNMTVRIEPHAKIVSCCLSKDYVLPDGTKAKVVDWFSDEKYCGNGLLAALQCLWLDGSNSAPLDALGWICLKVYWTGRREQGLEMDAKLAELAKQHAAEKAELERQLKGAQDARESNARAAMDAIGALNEQLAAAKRLARRKQRALKHADKMRAVAGVLIEGLEHEVAALREQVETLRGALNAASGGETGRLQAAIRESEEKSSTEVEPSTPPASDDKK